MTKKIIQGFVRFSFAPRNRQAYYLLSLFIGLNMFTNCKTTGNQIRVKGRAWDAGKLGACIFTHDSMLYLVNDMYRWPPEFEGRKLLVKGKLRIIRDTITVRPNDERQLIFGDQYKIDSATYRITIFGRRQKQQKEEDY